MIRRLDIKIVLILMVTVLVPLGVSVYLVLRAIDTSLGLGLNKELAAQLEASLEIRRQHIRELKRNMEQCFASLRDSHKLIRAATFGDDDAVRAVLREVIGETRSLYILRIAGTGERTIEERADGGADIEAARAFSMSEPVEWGPFTRVEAVFLVDTAFERRYQDAGKTFSAYEALVKAPPNYLKNRFVTVYLAIMSVGVALSILIGVLLARRLVRRIHSLSSATRLVGEGDLSVRVDSGSEDEVGELVESFNAMVSELAINRARIEYLQKISAWQEMARRLAHEIKNPLTPIQLAAQQIMEKYDGENPKFRRLLEQSTEIIKEEVATLRRLTSDFAAFAKLPEIVPENVDLGEFLEECRTSLEPVIEHSGVTVSFEDRSEGVAVLIDRIMMKRVIDNLVRNAAEAVSIAGVTEPKITVTARRRKSKKMTEAEIRVEDNGPGVLPEHHPSIFDPYFTTKSEGTGLGLAISKKIVLEHGGRIWLDEKIASGATFVVVLPALT
jgi:two-component system, NtrC family, nitrogen regulation sensor histidine kinase NtrY